MRYPCSLFATLLLAATASHAQAPLAQWHHLDPSADKAMGVSTDRAYALLRTLPGRPAPRPIIVAVIDGGVDTAHVDLRRVLWHNPQEIAGNGLDDDHNGYADDVYGWNFMGGTDGRNVFESQKEETRLYARLKPLYEGQTLATVPPARQNEFRLYARAKQLYLTKRAEAETAYQKDSQTLAEDQARLDALKKGYGVAVLDSGFLHHPPAAADTALTRQAAFYYQDMRKRVPTTDSLLNRYRRFNAELKLRLDYAYNLAYQPQPLAGEHPADLTERYTFKPALVTAAPDTARTARASSRPTAPTTSACAA